MPTVTDASVMVKLAFAERGSEEARAWYTGEVRAERPLLAPALLPYEVGRAIERAAPRRTAENQCSLLESSVGNVRLMDPRPRAVFEIASGGLTFYDAAYVALAIEQDATLATADKKMAAAARRRGVAVRTFPA